MKAVVYYENGGPEVFRYEDVPDPECRPNSIVIDIEAIGIQGGDVLNRAGGEIPQAPHVVGYQAAGTIREVGANVTSRSVGQRVVTFSWAGSHAALRAVHERQSWLIPDGLSTIEAAAIPIEFGTADDCLFEFGRLQAGETVVIQAGSSGVGLAAIQLAKRAGATVISTASSEAKLAILAEYGMDHGINYKDNDPVAEVMRLTDGKGAGLVVDTVGGDVLRGSLEMLAYRGRCVTAGNMSREERALDISQLIPKSATLTGALLGAELGHDRALQMIAGHLREAASGQLRMRIDKTFALSEAAAAHAYIESRQSVGRVVLIP